MFRKSYKQVSLLKKLEPSHLFSFIFGYILDSIKWAVETNLCKICIYYVMGTNIKKLYEESNDGAKGQGQIEPY